MNYEITSEKMDNILKTLNELTLYAEKKLAHTKDSVAVNKIDHYHIELIKLLIK